MSLSWTGSCSSFSPARLLLLLLRLLRLLLLLLLRHWNRLTADDGVSQA